ncbi:NUDIX domain-containing protein [Bacillus sp. FJAT-27245]|uniref:NUDIX domain-containing protein n=1 Tax=Bacillus sp. FJAT-27245 TaxID=1684144 RepID=UPI0006A7BF2C|nr:NUDIX domain-containing protein [Bacillus sp. FJAT-27245]
MNAVKKVYGYVTRLIEGNTQVLVFKHSNPEAGIQIRKGTVGHNEDTSDAVREIIEETGLKDFKVDTLLGEDFWKYDDGSIHNRFFYKITVLKAPNEWDYNPIGGGAKKELLLHLFVFNAAKIQVKEGTYWGNQR